MIYLYPANKMENLLALLNQIQRISPLAVFSKEVIIVQNAGMQHWLNMSLAQQRGISLNIDYALPSQYLWKLLRSLSCDKDIPEQSPFSREVLSWRIYALLADRIITDDTDFETVTHYWQHNVSTKNRALKRYQLAQQLADLYEQYLIFRPQWIDSWSANDFEFSMAVGNSKKEVASLSLWQGKLWRLLTRQQDYNPLALIKQAIENLPNQARLLPKRISFFGINVMPPLWLNLINAISQYTEVHFFHLNPCFAYWGDIITDKQAAKYLNNWLEGHDDPQNFVGNPLLANLGQQGREFVALLQDYSTINIEAFDDVTKTTTIDDNLPLSKPESKPSILCQIQSDILSLQDARIINASHNGASKQVNRQHDDSIVITSCHNALREVQGLHDWLLHQFNDDKSLTPKDVLVMCPQIESYAPYVNAVFTRGWQDLNNDVPPLPCSIADRSAKNSDPLVVAFLGLLALPDSRFQVSQLLSFLRVPALINKFDIPVESLDKIMTWLEDACVHWGLNAEHKTQLLQLNDKNKPANNNFTWQQGFSRLLTGFSFSDQNTVFKEQLLLSCVEGDDALLLGKLMLLLEHLQSFSAQLSTMRNAKQWQEFLLNNLNELFDESKDSEASLSIITQAISSLVNYCYQAHFNDAIELAIVQTFLDQHFSQPDPGRQFMIGQVTFCSMLPMRSIPFKVIAVLGLNDGDFPRQRQPLGFDLMAVTPVKLGDRSRRGDDRYLFLEAIISARKALYLSFQGRNIKNNKEKQPSIVLKELMDYLTNGYGWCFTDEEPEIKNDLRQLPMQAFSTKNYQNQWPSFDANWLKLAQQYTNKINTNKNTFTESHLPLIIDGNTDIDNADEQTTVTDPIIVDISQLITFYQHPAKSFANEQLNLYFQQYYTENEDDEPFVSDHLERYLLRENLLNAFLENEGNSAAIDDVLTVAKLSGKFPDLPTTEERFNVWLEESKLFSDTIKTLSVDNPELVHCDIALSVDISENHEPTNIKHIILTAQIPVKNDQCVFYRSSSAKAKDIFTLYAHQLFIQMWQQQQISSSSHERINKLNKNTQMLTKVSSTTGLYFDTKSQKVNQLLFTDISGISSIATQCENLLKYYFKGQKQACLLNTSLADKMFSTKNVEQGKLSQSIFESFWSEGKNAYGSHVNSTSAFGDDNYIHYFWPKTPIFTDYYDELKLIYAPVYMACQKVKVSSKAKTKSTGKGV